MPENSIIIMSNFINISSISLCTLLFKPSYNDLGKIERIYLIFYIHPVKLIIFIHNNSYYKTCKSSRSMNYELSFKFEKTNND